MLWRALLVLLLVPGTAHAGKYRVTLGDLPPALVDDAAGYGATLELDPGIRPSGPDVLKLFPSLSLPVPPVTALAPPPALDPRIGEAALSQPARVPGVQASLDLAMEPPPVPPSAQFLKVLNQYYNIQVQSEINGIWKWYLREPKALSDVERVGNAVDRFVLATSKTLPDLPHARPDLLKPQATSATVRAGIGVMVHAAPWGPNVSALPRGNRVQLVPPAHGAWYQVKGSGWVCGLWLDLQ